MRTRFLLLIVVSLYAVLGCNINIWGQTGPGGIGNSSTNPFWVDAHSLNLANGSKVSSWTDLSGNANDAIQSTPTAKPTVVSGTINGRDALDFNGAQFLTAGANSQLNNKTYINFYMYGNINNSSLLSIPMNLDYGVVDADAVFAGLFSQSGNFYSYTRKSPTTLIKTAFSTTSGYNLYEGVYNKTGNQLNSQTNFTLNNAFNTILRSAGTHQEIWVGGTNSFGSNHYYIDGQIAELFIFTFVLNTAQEKILENYISAKYGTSISNDMFSFQATHGLGVIGIGQDNPANMHIDSQGNGMVRINTPSALSDGEYLFTGHTDVDENALSFNIPDALPGSARFDRTWVAEKTGDLGTVTLIFDLDVSTDFSADGNNYRLIIDTDEDFSGTISQIVSGTYSSIDHTVTFTNVNLSTGNYFTLAGDAPEDIHSVSSSTWSDPNTWDCSCVPTAFNSVFIEPFNNVSVDIDAYCMNLSVEPNGTLTMGSSVTLNVGGNIDIIGDMSLTDGMISLSGNTDQYVDAGGNTVEFNDLEINNSGSGDITFYLSNYILNGTLFPTSGNMVIDPDPGNDFIINSTSDVGGGRVAAIGGGFSLSGNVTVRRFIPGGSADYRDICSPVIGATLTQWDDDLLISGVGFPDGCAYGTGGCFYSVKRYVINQYVDQTNMSNALTNGTGFEAYMGDDTITFSGTTLDVTGPIRDANDYAVSVGNQWQIQGNPYASPIQFSLITRSHVDNYFYVYDPATGFYEYWDGSDNSSSIPELANGIIATGQGFWTYNWGTLTYSETSKVSANASFVKAGSDTYPFQLSLHETVSTFHSSISLVESTETSDDLDTVRDIRHLSTGLEKAPTVAFFSREDELIRKNYIKADRRNKSFDLYTRILNEGYYTLTEQNIESVTSYSGVLLFDHHTGEFIDLKKEPSYTFYSEPFEGHRFTLVLTNEAYSDESSIQSLTINENPGSATGGPFEVTQMGHSFNVQLSEDASEDSNVSLTNVLGQTVVYTHTQRFVLGSNMITVPSDLKGIHILVITTGNSVVTKKIVL